MEKLEFHGLPADVHHCTSHREGSVIIWRCPLCEGYERRYNIRTGKMRVNRAGSAAQHTGFSTKAENMGALARVISLN